MAAPARLSAPAPPYAWARPAAYTLLAGWAARAAILLLKPAGVLSHDAQYWHVVGQKLLAGDNPYTYTNLLNYPPAWMQLVYAMERLAESVGGGGGGDGAFFTVLFLTLIAFESLLVLAVFWLLADLGVLRGWRAVLVGIALNPAAIFQVTIHGNFDVLMTLWVVLSLGWLVRFHRTGDPVMWLGAGGLLGLGILTKTVPVVLLPVLACGARKLTRQVKAFGVLLALGPAALGVSIIYVLGPLGVWDHVIQYRSVAGWYGITGVLGMLGVHPGVWGKPFAALVALWLALGSAGFYRTRLEISPRALALLAATVLLGVPTLGPGYGPQYVYWYLPLYVVAYACFEQAWWRRLLLAGFAVMVATYLAEYLVLQGGGLLGGWGYDTARLRSAWGTPTAHTLLRLPLFAASLAVLGGSVRLLRSEVSRPHATGS